MAAEPRLLEVEGLEVGFPARDGSWTTVLDGVSLTVDAGERVGLVGSSGSGKSLTALAILGLVPEPGEIRSGTVRVEGVEASAVPGYRGGVAALVFQEAGSALNPTFSVGYQLKETLEAHEVACGARAMQRAAELLEEVALEEPEAMLRAYPHQLSGGQAQRVMIALALAGEPRVLLADEPTTALDVITQRRILELLVRITEDRGLGLLLISHDLAVISGLVDRVLVMHRGRVVDEGPTASLLRSPAHPETRRLVDAARALRGGGRMG